MAFMRPLPPALRSILADTQDHLAAVTADHLRERLLVTDEREGMSDHGADLRTDVGPGHQLPGPRPGAVDLAADDSLQSHPAENDVLGIALQGDRLLLRQAEQDHLAAAGHGP